MPYKTGSQKSKSYKAEEDSAEVVNIDFRKVGDLDITVCCSICDEPVHISHLFHHKKAHQAQAVLGHRRPWIDPIDIKKTNLWRNQLILRMRKIAKYPERQIEKIGCSYDFLKETLKKNPYFCIKSVAQSFAQIKIVCNPLIKAIAICQDKNAIWHQDLEDVFVVIDNYGNRKDTCFLGLFDGANGISAAQTTSAELPLLLLDQLSRGDSSYEVSQAERKVLNSFCTIFRADYKLRELIFTARRVKSKRCSPKTHEWIHRAYAKSFWRMDRLLRLGRNETSRVRWSSCTAITCLVETISNKKQKQDEEGEGEKRSERLSHGKQPNATEQEEESSERFTGEKRKSNTEEETASTAEEQREKLIEGRNEEEEWISIQEDKELPKEMSRENRKSSIEQGMWEIIELQRDEPLGNMNGKKEENMQQEEELSERITGAKKKSTTEQLREKPIERRNEEEEQIQEEKELPKEMSRENRKSSTEQSLGKIIEMQREEPPGNMNEKKEENIMQQEEELSERIIGAKKKSNTGEEIGSTTEQQREKPTERRNEEEEQIQEEKELPKEMSRENRKSSTEQSLGKIIEMQREEPPGNMNEKKEENIMQQEEELSERITGAKTKSNTRQRKGSITDYQREEPNERMIEDAENQSVVQQEEELPERITKGKRTSNMEQETGSIIMEQPRMESTDRMNATKQEHDVIPQEGEQIELPELTVREREKSTMDELQEEQCEINKQMTKAEVEQSTNHKDEIQEDSLENSQSSDEPSVGIMHIANIGNVHAVLCKNGESYWLTKEHTTYCRKEKIRVIRNDGQISSNEPKGLIEGLTKNTRGLGHHGNLQLKKTVIPVPHTISFPVDDSCQFLILATNGLWEVLDRREVVLLTLTMFSAYLQKYHHRQLKKSHFSKYSKFPLGDMEDELYLWYSNQDFFQDRDKNLSQSNAPLPPINSVTRENTPIQSRFFITNSEDEESESSLEPPSISISSSEDTAERLRSVAGSGARRKRHNKTDESSQISEDSEGNSRTFYDLAAKYISKHLVNAALKAGSRDNITVLVVLLNGCDKIPTYL